MVCRRSGDVLPESAGFGRFAERLAQEFRARARSCLAAAIDRGVGDERAEPLAAVDDAVALELFVGALDGDHADQQFLGEAAERGQRRPAASRPSLTSRFSPSTICW